MRDLFEGICNSCYCLLSINDKKKHELRDYFFKVLKENNYWSFVINLLRKETIITSSEDDTITEYEECIKRLSSIFVEHKHTDRKPLFTLLNTCAERLEDIIREDIILKASKVSIDIDSEIYKDKFSIYFNVYSDTLSLSEESDLIYLHIEGEK